MKPMLIPGAGSEQTKSAPEIVGPLNQILHGPPGTGKTFDTIRRAVEIIDGAQAPTDRGEVKARYDALCRDGRIAFVTFHQSYGYEDFVEGIRPVITEPGSEAAPAQAGDVRYECRPGVFRRVCALAAGVRAQKHAGAKVDLRSTPVWKMSLGWTQRADDDSIYEDCIDNDRIALGYGNRVDFTGCDDRKSIAKKAGKKEDDFSIQAVDRFKNQMKKGDLVVISDGNLKFRAIGRVAGEYGFLASGRYPQVRKVDWLLVLEESQPYEKIQHKQYSQSTIYRLKREVLKEEALNELLSTNDGELHRYVLIIDEINRGNVSKIFGELITLLEADKRDGAPHALSVQLPYSGDRFSVPGNLYVIGTMNTADRSIALLDTALRRRFSFVEMMPRADVLREVLGNDGMVENVDVAQLLDTLNDRIEAIYDREHALGHAYFMDATSLDALRSILLDKILPLLQEYFYGDWQKIACVLGCARENGATPNAHPVLQATALSAPGVDFAGEARLRYIVSPSFRRAAAGALQSYFDAMIDTTAAPKSET